MRLVRHAAVAALAALALTTAAAERAPKPSEVMLPEGFAPLSDRDKTLTSVPFAPGAPAVVLLEGMQYQWEESFVRTRRVRRVKILTTAGAPYADYTHSFTGEWRMNSVRARTILADGTEIDASSNIHVEISKAPDMAVVSVTFPRAEPGAILDFAMDANVNNARVSEWVVQEGIPVLESRLLLIPPPGDRYRTGFARMKAEDVHAHSMRYGNEQLFAWIVRDVPPLPDVPYMLPRGEVSRKIVLARESYRYGDVAVQLASTWPVFCKDLGNEWDSWLRKRSTQCAQLATQVAGAAPTPRAKAEAIMALLRTKMSSAYEDYFPTVATPDAALDQSRGNSADMAGVAISMLSAVGVKAHVAAYRLRSSGALPTEYPMPSMLDDVLVVIPAAGADGKDLLLPVDSDLPFGVLPAEATGVFMVPFRKDSPGPVFIPDPPAERNAIRRETTMMLGLDASVKAESRLVFTGTSAHELRSRLSKLPADDRRKAFETDLRRLAPSAIVSNAAIEHLDDPMKDLVVTLSWEAAGLAASAGGRLLLNPFVFERMTADDWGAEKRDQEIWLGRPFLRKDDVTITMPQGIASVQLAAGAVLEAGEVGGYRSEFSGKDLTLTASRTLKFEQTLFPASSWDPLKAWFQDMAKADDQSIVFTLAEKPD